MRKRKKITNQFQRANYRVLRCCFVIDFALFYTLLPLFVVCSSLSVLLRWPLLPGNSLYQEFSVYFRQCRFPMFLNYTRTHTHANTRRTFTTFVIFFLELFSRTKQVCSPCRRRRTLNSKLWQSLCWPARMDPQHSTETPSLFLLPFAPSLLLARLPIYSFRGFFSPSSPRVLRLLHNKRLACLDFLVVKAPRQKEETNRLF